MKIHEYQAKEILAQYGVAVPKGEMANTLEEANTVARNLFAEGASGVVVKAQIHAGGRGKGGGVKVAKTREDAELHGATLSDSLAVGSADVTSTIKAGPKSF